MKKIFQFSIMLLFCTLAVSCQAEPTFNDTSIEIHDILKSEGVTDFNLEEVNQMVSASVSSSDECFVISDLQSFFVKYGDDYEYSPDIVPAFNNYYQDISIGADGLDNRSLYNGIEISNLKPSVTSSLSYKWFWDNRLGEDRIQIANSFQFQFNELSAFEECSGGGIVTLEITDSLSGAVYSRSMVSFIGVNGTGFCDNGFDQFDAFNESIWPQNIEPYEYLEDEYDFNSDKKINALDLQSMLSCMCGS